MGEAERLFRSVLKSEPHDPVANHGLSLVSVKQGEVLAAIPFFLTAVNANPWEHHYWLSFVEALIDADAVDEAQFVLEKASASGLSGPELTELEARLKPRKMYQQSLEHYLAGRLAEAEHGFAEILSSDLAQPDSLHVLGVIPEDLFTNLALTLEGQGKVTEAIAMYDAAIRLKLDKALIHNNLILALIYAADFPATELVRRARDFGEVFAAPLLRERRFSNVVEPDRRLRVGFVSGNFPRHSVNYFFEPLLLHLDRQQFEVFAYPNISVEDSVTARLKDSFDYWRDIRPLAYDDKAADLIEADRIDILVDLSGHMAANRLLVFARKPAPIQATWLGFTTTTGVKAIDYRITDGYVDPVGMTEHFNVETLWRLPGAFCCYEAPKNGPVAIDHPPRDDNGYVTFGCFNNFTKVSDRLLRRWAEILTRVPDARLLLEIMGIDGEEFRRETEARLERLGLPVDRVILEFAQCVKSVRPLQQSRHRPRSIPVQRRNHHHGRAMDGRAGCDACR